MLIVWFFFAYKKLAQFAVRCALPPRRSESPVCTTDNKPSRVLHLLGWFIGSRGFSSLEQRPNFGSYSPCSQSYGFSSSHVWMWELEHKEGWGPKNWCFWIVVLEEKILMPGKTEGRRRRGQQRMTWLHGITAHEFEQTLGDSEGQGSLACCSPWSHKELNRTEQLNNNKTFYYFIYILLISFYLFLLSESVTYINVL